MTNKNILDIFESRYPDLKVEDYRPYANFYVADLEGITIFLKNGDTIQYFPKVLNKCNERKS